MESRLIKEDPAGLLFAVTAEGGQRGVGDDGWIRNINRSSQSTVLERNIL